MPQQVPDNPSDFPPEEFPTSQYDNLDGIYLWDSVVFSVLAPISLLIQLGCIIHVFKTGRPFWWMWVILWFPFVGVLAYVFLEIRPSWRASGFDFKSLMWRFKSSDQRIAELEARLDHSGTIKNRLALASELQSAGRFDRQCEVLQEGLYGAFEDDNDLRLRLVEAQLNANKADEAEQLLSNIVPSNSKDQQAWHTLLKARVEAAQGRSDNAEALFSELNSGRKSSEAPRYYFAEFLVENGRTEEGNEILRDIIRKYRGGTVVWRHCERKWFYAARKRLPKQ